MLDYRFRSGGIAPRSTTRRSDIGPGARAGETRTTAANPWAYFGLGFEIAVPIVLCIFLGYKADQWLGSEPWLLVVGALLGITLAFYNLFRRVLRSGDRGEGDR